MANWSAHLHELATRRYPALLAYATLLTGQRATAEDLVQDALLRTFGRPRRLPTLAQAESYVKRAILTLFLDSTRRRATLLRSFSRVAEPPVQPDETHVIDDRDEVARALAELSPQVRAAIVLRYYDDLTVAGVAQAMGIATGTAKRYLSDGIGRLREDLGERHVPDDPLTDADDVTVTIAPHGARRNS